MWTNQYVKVKNEVEGETKQELESENQDSRS